MLDIFGNLLGKSSKKNSNQQQANGGNGQTDNDSNSDSYVFVSNNNSAVYSQTTILTDEMIRQMGSSSSVATSSSMSSQGQQQQQQQGPSSMVYPSLDVTNGYNPNLPFSSVPMPSHLNHPQQRHSLATPYTSNHARTASPIDNVPFVLTNYSSANGNSSGGGYDEDAELGETISRVQQFLANPNISEYNFKLENGLLTATY